MDSFNHPHIYAYYIPWKSDVNSNVETITHDFYFFEIFETKFFIFQCNERDHRSLLSFYNRGLTY